MIESHKKRSDQEKVLIKYCMPLRLKIEVKLGIVSFRASSRITPTSIEHVIYLKCNRNFWYFVEALILLVLYSPLLIVGFILFFADRTRIPHDTEEVIYIDTRMSRSYKKRVISSATSITGSDGPISPEYPIRHRGSLSNVSNFGSLSNMSKKERRKWKKAIKKEAKKQGLFVDPSFYNEDLTLEEWEEMMYSEGESSVYHQTGNGKTYNPYVYHEKTEIPKHVKTWTPELPLDTDEEEYDEEAIGEDEARIFNLRKSLEEGHYKSVERFFKKKCNIYATDFGYALERVGRERHRLYLDLALDYVKVWQLDDYIDKKDLLNNLINEYEKGRIQLSSRETLEEILTQIDKKVPEGKENLLECYFNFSSVPEELKLTRIKGT